MARQWFRFGRKPKESATTTVAAVEVAPEEPGRPELQQDPVAPQEATDPVKKRRRRGSRGGRGKKKTVQTSDPADAAVAASATTPDKTDAKEPARGRPERKQERRPTQDRRASKSGRRRTPTRRAPLPAAKRDLVISVDVGEQRVAVLEDDRVAEVYLERPERRSIAGNIYLGVVDNVLPGMEAAFVEIGLEKNGFLYVDEIVGPELEGRKGAKKIQDLIRRGETVLVQAVKDPMKSKGARLTTEISLPGRFLVYVPNGEGYGVSRRLEDDERARLKEIVRALDAKGGGIIVRTAAEGASAEDIERDLVFLQRLWKTIQTKANGATAPSIVYEEAELPLRIVRDLFAGDFSSALIDDDRTHRRIVSYLKKTSPHMIERVQRYREKAPLFEAYGVDKEIQSTLERRVNLPSGGYLIFDYAEAFTVIDVNTGRFVGSRGKASAGRLEDTIVKNNLEAVKEVVRQLRLRDIGGIIVIDFIDMSNPKNRETVEEALRTELERDRTKTYVVEISPLGLVEMTRQNVTDGPREILTRRCPICEGDGFVVSDETMAIDIERRLRTLAAGGARAQAFRVAVHPRVLSLLVGPGGGRLAAIEAAARRRFFLVAAESGHLHLDHFELLEQGKLDALKPTAPFAEDETISVKLVEVGLYDAGAGVAKLDGYDIVVADAAKLVGKKISVTIGRVLDGIAFGLPAELVAADGGITFEAEAEKPTRPPSRKKTADTPADTPAAEPTTEPESELELEVELEVEDDVELGVAAEAESGADEVATDSAPAKKRTRRGSRGGKGRKKKPAASDVPEGEGDAAAGNGARGTPTIHMPPPDLGVASQAERTEPVRTEPDEAVPAVADPTSAATELEAEPVAESAEADGAPKKKRTRRGTRGGRKRRKPATNGATAVAVADAPAAQPATEVVDAEGEAEERKHEDRHEDRHEGAQEGAQEGKQEYVPMSEWIEDFDSRSRPRTGSPGP
ncbi:MAG: Rne/Rng family ribonuclease [Actinobacteria bacterium]|nr:Rne/Rng family ribonuclease [Actinomycetota bacterium]